MTFTTPLSKSLPKKISLILCLVSGLHFTVIPEKPTLAQNVVSDSQSMPQHDRVIHVDSIKGDDRTGQGNLRSPFKTITQALMLAEPKTKIVIAPGQYTRQSGEQFPLILHDGIILEGNPRLQGNNFVIEGSGFYISPTGAGQNVTIVAHKNAGGIIGVTVTNPDARGQGIWVESASPIISGNTITRTENTGISVNGKSNPKIANNYFFNNTGNGLSVYGLSQPLVENNEFHRTGFGVSGLQNSRSILVGNTFRDNRIGVILEGKATATLRNNQILNSTEVGLMTIALATADLGYQQQAGGNLFRGNRLFDIKNSSDSQIITAFGNQISGQIQGKIDLKGVTTPANPVKVAAAAPPPTSERPLTSPPPAPPSSNPTLSRATAINAVPEKSNSAFSQVPAQGRVIDISAPASANQTDTTAINSNRNVPSLPAREPATEVIDIGGNLTPRPPMASGNAIASNRTLPEPPPVSEPYRPQEGAPEPPPSRSSPASSTPISAAPSPFEENSPDANSTRRSLADILVVAPEGGQAPAAAAPLAGGSPYSNSPAYSQSSQYKVIVEARTDLEQSRVKNLYPDSFRTKYNGRSMLQIGVFSTRQNAEQALQSLTSIGLNGAIVP